MTEQDAAEQIVDVIARINDAWIGLRGEAMTAALNECFAEEIVMRGQEFVLLGKGRDFAVQSYHDFVDRLGRRGEYTWIQRAIWEQAGRSAMAKQSAGLLMFRRRGCQLEVMLVHPGGPFWAKKDLGAWTIPKGEYAEGEEPLAAARREFAEETGLVAEGEFVALGEVRQAGGKLVRAWAFEGEYDPGELRSNLFEMEWPPRSGKMAEFPEVDRAGWFSIAEARERILKGQAPLLDALVRRLGDASRE